VIRRRGSGPVAAWVFAAVFGGSGALHLLRPAVFDGIVPPVLPGSARFWTTSSGVAELALAAGFAVPAARRVAGPVAAGFLLAVWPANGQMAVDAWRVRSRDRAAAVRCAVALVRLPLQVPLVRAAWRVR